MTFFSSPLKLAGFICFLMVFSGLQGQNNLRKLDSLTGVYIKFAKYQEALPYAEKLVKATEKKYGQQDTHYVDALNKLALAHYSLGHYQQVISQWEKVRTLNAQIHGEEDPEYARSLFNLGSLYRKLGQLEKALALFEEAEQIWQSSKGKKDPDYRKIVINIAVLHHNMGNFKAAEDLYLKAQGLFIQDETDPLYASNLNNLALLYQRKGLFEKAEPLYLKLLELDKSQFGKIHPNYAKSLSNMALLYEQMERYDEAEQLLLEAYSIEQKVLPDNHPDIVKTLSNLANIFAKHQQFNKAIKYFDHTQKLLKETLGEEHPQYAQIVHNEASAYLQNDQYEKALPLFLKAKSVWAKTLGTNHPDYASNLSSLATCYKKLKNYDKAWAYFEDALHIYQKSYGNYHPQILRLLNLEALLNIEMHQYEKAKVILHDCIHINGDFEDRLDTVDMQWRERIETHPPLSYSALLESLNYYYQVQRAHYNHHRELNDLKALKIITQTAMEMAEQYRHQFSSDKDKLRVLAKSVKWSYKAIQATIELAEEQRLDDFQRKAFSYAEQSKSALLSEAVKNDMAHIFGDLPDSLATKEQDLLEEKSSLSAQLLETTDPAKKQSIRQELNQLQRKIKAFQSYLAEQFPRYNALKYAQDEVSTQLIQELLDEETALIEYVIADTVVYIFYIDKTHFKLFPIPVPKEQIHLKIRDFRKSLSDYKFIKEEEQAAYLLFHQTGYWFYQQLLAPVLSDPAIKHLLLIPDGELCHVPFGAFLTEPGGEAINYKELPYLLRKYKISYDFSASLWDENERDYLRTTKTRHAGKMLALAASYQPSENKELLLEGRRSAREQQLRNAMPDLPAARQEVAALEALFQGDFWMGEDANERDFKKAVEHYDIVHLAMHGLLDKQHPILSSLAFTENGDSTEDNFLHAYEIAHLHLNTELVVLSACETGYGKFEQGEGVISLARSFMYAGVPSLIVSMWEVNDYSTSKIMELFYRKLADGMDKAAALQQAKLEYIAQADDKRAHPAYWAPFIQLGDHHPVHLKQKSTISSWGWTGLLALGLLVLVGGGLWAWRARRAIT